MQNKKSIHNKGIYKNYNKNDLPQNYETNDGYNCRNKKYYCLFGKKRLSPSIVYHFIPT